MNSIFTYRDNVEGKIGIGKIPDDILHILDEISTEYNAEIPDKNASTYHTWYDHMTPSIKHKVNQVQMNPFWDKLCDHSDKCTKISAKEMDELYYSNPKNNLTNINLYGASTNYDIHRDCIFNFNGIKFYRVLIGLTDGNDNIVTHFTNINIGHKLNSGDVIVFDFDKSTHQVIKEREEHTPRILLKLHYIVCENCEYSQRYVENIKQIYIFYEIITRYVMQVGTDPKTFYQFFWGLICQYSANTYIWEILLFILSAIVLSLHFIFKIAFKYKNIITFAKYTSLIFTGGYLSIVLFYWARYQLTGIR